MCAHPDMESQGRARRLTESHQVEAAFVRGAGVWRDRHARKCDMVNQHGKDFQLNLGIFTDF